MIYISTSCVKHIRINESVQELVDNGFYNIELSGGTQRYENFEDDLLELKEKYNLNYICHNYFPPPKKHLVLNLASLNNDIYTQTFEHLTTAIALSKKLGAKSFGFHAGFFLDLNVNEIGKAISKNKLFNSHDCINKFCKGFDELKIIAGSELELYIENNVYSSSNSATYNNEKIFMLTHYQDYLELEKVINFKLLLDVAHLKVSATTLDLNFESEMQKMVPKSDYIHISDNDGLHDLNNILQENSALVRLLKKQDLSNKNFTLEIYEKMENIKKTHDILSEITND